MDNMNDKIKTVDAEHPLPNRIDMEGNAEETLMPDPMCVKAEAN